MNKFILDNSPACEPITATINLLQKHGYKKLEAHLEDFHFHQLYFKVDAHTASLETFITTGVTRKDDFIICDCHWSRIEFAGNVG
jgi:hypothetical protein